MVGGINPSVDKAKRTSGSIDIRLHADSSPSVTVLISGQGAESGTSGFQNYVHGNVTLPELRLDSWGAGDVTDEPMEISTSAAAASAAVTTTAASWTTSMTISPNNHNFPSGDLTTASDNLPIDDLAAIMTGIYGSAPGCLCTFPNSPSCPGMEGKHQKLGQIATTIARGNDDRGYGGTYNYFDPDNFFSMTALIYSGEPFLQEQARTVIERSGSFLCIGAVQKDHKCTYGQLPHHFQGTTPTFLALR
jgi:hypothetical protein